jgi:hypothetical protein
MAVQIYSKEFVSFRKRDGIVVENDMVVRKKALEKANEFFFEHESFYVINIVENWEVGRNYLRLVVYYKDYC